MHHTRTCTHSHTRTYKHTYIHTHTHTHTQVDGYSFEARPEGTLLLYSNDDKPGVLGAVSTILGNKNINIGDFNMGRNKKKAIALRSVDKNFRGLGFRVCCSARGGGSGDVLLGWVDG